MKQIRTILKNIPTIITMTNYNGNDVANQLTVHTNDGSFFISYGMTICCELNDGRILLDEYFWDYSKTTGIYRNDFLGETMKDTREKIASGEYKLVNLN